MARERGVSSVVGVVLILGITIAAMTSVMLIGAIALQTSQAETKHSQMETSMAQMSSKASLSALGSAEMQRFDLGDTGEGSVVIDETAGNVTIEWVEGTNVPDEENLSAITPTQNLGAIVYTQDDHEVAFQGGGVWKRTGDDGGEMISPPEYHYHRETLTFPIIRVTGEGGTKAAAQGTIEHAGFESIFPDEVDPEFSNPVENKTIWVHIESDYHAGWYEFFDSRSDGDIHYDPDNQSVRVELSAAFEVQVTHAVGLQGDLKIDRESITGSWGENLNFHSASDAIDQRIADCEAVDWSPSLSSSDTIDGPGQYCENGDAVIDAGEDIDTTDGDVDIVVNGSLEFGGSNHDDLTINGDGVVRIFVKGDITIEVQHLDINTAGDADQLQVYVHSDAETIDMSNHGTFRGLIYAPNSNVEFGADPVVEGSIIAHEIHNQNPGISPEITFREELAGVSFGFDSGIDVLRYLHITDNRVKIELD